MSRKIYREDAIRLRLLGHSYREIKEKINVSKNTLSLWLRKFPLPDNGNPDKSRGEDTTRIEKCIATKRLNYLKREDEYYQKSCKELGKITGREKYLMGLSLYWAEGTKAERGRIEFTNSDPGMIKFYVSWLRIQKIDDSNIKIRLQLYSNMDEMKEKAFWSVLLGIRLGNFKKSYIKKSNSAGLSYRTGFKNGTCMIIVNSIEFYLKVMADLKYLREYKTI